MTTFHDLEAFTTPSRVVEDSDARTLVAIGGYTHPLFTDAGFAAATPFGRTPLPGQAVLLVMGGLVEQSGRFDSTTIALTSLDEVRFRAPAFPGDTLQVGVDVLDRTPRGERGELRMRWTCTNGSGRTLVEAVATMLFRLEEP